NVCTFILLNAAFTRSFPIIPKIYILILNKFRTKFRRIRGAPRCQLLDDSLILLIKIVAKHWVRREPPSHNRHIVISYFFFFLSLLLPLCTSLAYLVSGYKRE
ncbi:unnamed protein product, partial [Ixodes persulcatus]